MKIDAELEPAAPHEVAVSARTQESAGFSGLWTTETAHDPFLPLATAAEHTSQVDLGTAIAVAFARNPVSLAMVANDLQTASNGRFILGLGSQTRAHIERRFSMPWGQPAARMREMIHAIQAVWRSWYEGERLEFDGDFYPMNLMTPFFNPGPNPFGPPRIYLAAVGVKMTEVAAEAADGLFVHAFTTERYLREVTIPVVEAALSARGAKRSDFELSYPGFIVTGLDEEELAESAARARGQIAFYGSTPDYRAVLELHGWGDLQTELNALAKSDRPNRWQEMGALVDDEVLETFAIVAEPEKILDAIENRFEGIVDRFRPYFSNLSAQALSVSRR